MGHNFRTMLPAHEHDASAAWILKLFGRKSDEE